MLYCYYSLSLVLFFKIAFTKRFRSIDKTVRVLPCKHGCGNTITFTRTIVFILSSAVFQSVSLYFADRYTIEYEINLCKFGFTRVLAPVQGARTVQVNCAHTDSSRSSWPC